MTAKFRNFIFCGKFFCVRFVLCLPAFSSHIARTTSDSADGADWRLYWRPESSHTTSFWPRLLTDCQFHAWTESTLTVCSATSSLSAVKFIMNVPPLQENCIFQLQFASPMQGNRKQMCSSYYVQLRTKPSCLNVTCFGQSWCKRINGQKLINSFHTYMLQ